ncbi:MAG: hypothetical protein ACYCYN_07305 [Solirubrobacteraceae bacterium]
MYPVVLLLGVSPAISNAAACGSAGQEAAGISGPSLSVSGSIPSSLTASNADGQTVTLDHAQLERAATIIAVGKSEEVDAGGHAAQEVEGSAYPERYAIAQPP